MEDTAIVMRWGRVSVLDSYLTSQSKSYLKGWRLQMELLNFGFWLHEFDFELLYFHPLIYSFEGRWFCCKGNPLVKWPQGRNSIIKTIPAAVVVIVIATPTFVERFSVNDPGYSMFPGFIALFVLSVSEEYTHPAAL